MTDENISQPENYEKDMVDSDEANEALEALQEAAPENVQALKDELVGWQTKANEYLDGWQRARADYANYKKRVERDQAQAHQNAAINVIRRFLDVKDDLELALKNRLNEGDDAGWADGVELIYRKLSGFLEAEGVRIIGTDGKIFDPKLHEAITQEAHPQL